MFEPRPLATRGHRSDRHGVIERYSTLALPGPLFDPRDSSAHGCRGTRSANTCAWTALSRGSASPTARASGTRMPTNYRRRCDRKRGSRATEADGQAIARRSGHPRLRRLLLSRGRLARDWKAARQQEQKTQPWRFRSAGVFTWRAFQFDWSEDWAIIGGERTKLQVAHFKLSYSRAFVLRVYPQQTHGLCQR